MTEGKLQLVVSTDVVRLFEAAAEGFLRPLEATPADPYPTPGYLLALRQGGLRDDLIRLAARQGCRGWFDPPLCIFHELPAWLGEPDTWILSEIARHALIGDVVRRISGGVFARMAKPEYYLASLDSFIGELVSEGVAPQDFERAAADLNHDEASFNARKNAELASIYRGYVAALERAGARDGRDSLAAAADILNADPDGLSNRLGGRREIRIFGLADLRGGWRRLLNALAASPALDRIRIYSATAFSEAETADLPAIEILNIEGRTTIATALLGNSDTGPDTEQQHGFSVVEAPNVRRELNEVALEVRRLVDRGVRLHRIAVVARRGRPYTELVVRALKLVGVPAAARLRIAFTEIPVVKAVLCLLAAAVEGWTRQRLAELASLPYFEPLNDPSAINYIGFRKAVRGLSAWEKAIADLRSEALNYSGGNGDEDQPTWNGPSIHRIDAAATGLRALRAHLGQLDRDRSLPEWISWMESLIVEDPFDVEKQIYSDSGSSYEPIRKDIAGWSGLKSVLGEWKSAESLWGGNGTSSDPTTDKISAAEFSKRLREMLDGQIGIWTQTQRGVQVLEALAAAYRGFHHVFLVGMDAGSFPLPARRSPILDDEDRSHLGASGIRLDTRADWDSRERDLFRALVSGARQLTVSYPSIDARGADTMRSSFVEALADVAAEQRLPVDPSPIASPDTPFVTTTHGRALAAHAASVEIVRESGRSSPFTGHITDEALLRLLAERFDDNRLWSPTQIEAYAKCPWAYFSSRLLGAEKLEDPNEEMEASVRGSLLHATLARFYDRVAAERGRPVQLTRSDLAWANPLMAVTLQAEFEAMQERIWTGHPVLRGVKQAELLRELCRYLSWEVEFHERLEDTGKSDVAILRTAVHAHEKAFGEHGDVVLERNGVRFKFRGSIDRVEIGIDSRIGDPTRFVAAVDYKSSLSGVPGRGVRSAWNEGVVLQIPLYAYALTRIDDAVTVSRVEYRPLKETKPGATPGNARAHCLQLYQFDKKTGDLARNEGDSAKMEQALDKVSECVLAIRGGLFPPSPAPSCGCPAYCHGYDICRVSPDIRGGRRQ